jgi:hypothetical protein
MTLDSLDQLLAEWKNTMDTAAQNVMELHNLPSYEILIGGSGASIPQLAGVTKGYLAPAIAANQQLLNEFGVLSDTIQRAVGIRQQVPRFGLPGADLKIREIERLLLQPCISVPSNGGLSGPETAISARQLLAHMNGAFHTAHDALLEVDRVWKRLDAQLAAAAALLRAHATEASTDALRQQVESLRSRVIHDPLGAAQEFDRDVQPVLTRTKAMIESLIEQRANVHGNIARARDLLRKLVELRRQVEESYAECKEKITGHSPATPPVQLDRIASLYGWLTRLEAKLAEGYIDPVCIGLENWMANITELIEHEERACAENLAPLALRRELRGRLSALKAKALARGVAEDTRLIGIAERAGTLLHARPTPMREAGDLVSQYESKLNGRSS